MVTTNITHVSPLDREITRNSCSARYVHYQTWDGALCTAGVAPCRSFFSEYESMSIVFSCGGCNQLWSHQILSLVIYIFFVFTARSRMLVFIDEHGFFYCLASNNTLCWCGVIFIARTPVCTARKERIWPEVATIVHSLIGQNEPCSLLWTTDITIHSSTSKLQNIQSKMQRITLKKTFNVWSFYCFLHFFFSLTQLWLCYMVYKHEKERNALKLMHISLHLKESCVNQCIDEVLWGLKALHRVLTSECAKNTYYIYKGMLFSNRRWTFLLPPKELYTCKCSGT